MKNTPNTIGHKITARLRSDEPRLFEGDVYCRLRVSVDKHDRHILVVHDSEVEVDQNIFSDWKEGWSHE